MTELHELTLAYLRQRPESAARALEELDDGEAAAILLRAPSRIAAPVLAAMTTLYAARCVTKMPPEVAAARCNELSWSDSAGLLRALDAPVRDALLAEMPEGKARRFRRSLDYADDAIGAWVELDAPAMTADRSVAEASRLLAGISNYAENHLLLTDSSQRYVGAVALGALLASGPETGLATMVLQDLKPLRDSASLGSAIAATDWERSTILPVVNHRGELLGGMTQRTLRQALHHSTDRARDESPLLFTELLQAYLSSGEGLLRLLLQAPRARGRMTGNGR